MKPKKSMDELRWIRVFTPSHIPTRLVEQVTNRDYSVEDFFKYQELTCLRQTPEGPTLNPLSHLYVLADDENMTQGFLWFTVDPLAKDLVVQTYSVDKDYWGGGKAVAKLADHIKEIRKKANLNKVYWVTDYPKHSMRYGFKRSDSVLMEYTEEDEEDGKNHDGVLKSGELTEPRTTKVSK